MIYKEVRNEPKFQWEDAAQDLVLVVICFLIGRVVIFDGVSPFGAALFTTLIMKKKPMGICLLAIAAGILSVNMHQIAFKYMGAVGMLFIYAKLLTIANKNKGDQSPFKMALYTLITLWTSSLVYGYINGFLMYDLILSGLEGAAGFVMVYVFNHAANAILDRNRRILSNEELISLGIFLALIVTGFWNVEILGLSVRMILTVGIVLLFAAVGGSGVGTSIGIAMGLILSLASGSNPILIANLGVCGLVAGIFRDLGRLGVGCAFILANALMTFYINQSTTVILPLEESAAGIAVVLLIPRKGMEYLKQFLDSSMGKMNDQDSYIHRMQELTVGRLHEFSQVFNQLSRVFNRISQRKVLRGHDELSQLFDMIANQVCSECALYGSCWKRDFYHTYGIMFDLLTVAETKGKLSKQDIPAELSKKCFQLGNLIDTMNNIYFLYRSNLKWHKKLDECRQLVGHQLMGVSKVITQLAAELDLDVRFKKDLEGSIHIELDKKGIRVGDVLVIEKSGGKAEVSLSKAPCGGRRECLRQIEKVVSSVMGKNMVCQNRSCINPGKGRCTLHLTEAQQYQVITGISRKAKGLNKISGDSYTFTSIKDGKYMLALSDGMGSGSKAEEESSSLISMLENFMEAGFDLDLTIKTINSVLILRSEDEIFATADLCVIDLITGDVSFVKIGGVSTFIKRQNHVQIIKAYSLPIGILEEVQLETVSASIEDDDMIVMVTDGVLDVIEPMEEKDIWLANIIAEKNTLNPQELSDHILDEALLMSNGEARDDMTVMVSRVYRQSL